VFVPAGVLTIAGIATLFLLRETPGAAATDSEFGGDDQRSLPVKREVSENLYLTLYNPTLWLLGLSLGLLNACRYGFLDWGLTHLMEVQQTTIGKAGLKYCVIALGAVLGSYCAGVATDRFFGGRRAPVVCLLLLLLGLLTLLYESVSRSSVGGTIVLLAVIGFCIYGPQVLLVGTAPADLAHKGTAAAAAGFVNFMGYMGAATGDVVTGYYSVPEHGGWELAISIWAGWAFAAALASGLLWNATTSQLRLLAGWVPVVVGVSVLLLSAVLVFLITGVHWVVITASGGAVLLLVARHREPRLAWFTGIASLAGLIGLLLGWVPDQGLSSWYTVLPRIGHGLGVLTALMVVVEKR
jgi:sugar phosphate permease